MNVIKRLFRENREKREYRKMIDAWFADDGDGTLRLDYDLNEDSLVFDLGGYRGQWTSDIYARFNCTVFCFEPVDSFAHQIKKRFSKNKKIHVYQLGLSNETKKVMISHSADGSSIVRGQGDEEINLIRAIDFIRENNIQKIDLLKINIEGGEYDLLDHLISSKFVSNIDDIQVQFHNFFPEAKDRMKQIHVGLSRTHYVTWQYEFVWENWKNKRKK
ncbi:MAG: FkbM family methyltransferase [Deltaproteobacteria bacterium]|nr:FkbM family methyltransferase [Deltaproteobacteria bacterium]